MLLLSTLILGVLMGGASAAFLTLLEWVTAAREQHLFLVAFLPAVGVLTAFVYHKFGKNSQRGNNLIIDSVHKQAHVPFRMAFFTFTFTILTHLTGGSVGREGTAVQIGGTLANKIGNFFKLNEKMKPIFILSGISAGFGSVFGTPLAGAFFGMEMCFIGKLSYEALLPCFITSFTADYVTRLFGVSHAAYEIQAVPAISLYNIAVVIAASCVFGLTGRLFAVSVHKLKGLYAKLMKQYALRAFAGSLIVLAVMFSFNTVKYDGLSTWMISAGFRGEVHFFDPVLKFVMTVLSLGAGFQGGEVTPLFDMGASLGGLIGQAAHVSPSLLAALGLISVFGCAANTPLTTIMLGIELFGAAAMPYYVVAALISYYVSGHNGIYSSQLIHTSKYHRQEHAGQTLETVGNRSLLDLLRKHRRGGHYSDE
jgi:H+/Cl- antiporter ClcA